MEGEEESNRARNGEITELLPFCLFVLGEAYGPRLYKPLLRPSPPFEVRVIMGHAAVGGGKLHQKKAGAGQPSNLALCALSWVGGS
jgi:hypothetical protein